MSFYTNIILWMCIEQSRSTLLLTYKNKQFLKKKLDSSVKEPFDTKRLVERILFRSSIGAHIVVPCGFHKHIIYTIYTKQNYLDRNIDRDVDREILPLVNNRSGLLSR